MERTTRSEDLATVGFSLWTIVGLFVDAYNHVTNPQLETFWTPWHAIFYSGFLATAAWLIVIRLRRRQPAGTDLFWAPQGYRPAMYGVAIFAAGGVGDAIWHEVFGIETSLDALLSPTHLLLFIGGFLIVSAPFRARWMDRNDASPSYRDFLPALASLSFATAVVAFFFEYSWAPAMSWPVTLHYEPGAGSEQWAVLGFLGIMVTTIITFAPLLAASRRWTLPPGSVTTFMVVINTLIVVGFDKEAIGLPAVVAAAVLMDVLIAIEAPRRLTIALPPFALWSLYFLLVTVNLGLGWPPELWGGSILFAVLAVVLLDRLLEMAVEAASLDRADALQSSEGT